MLRRALEAAWPRASGCNLAAIQRITQQALTLAEAIPSPSQSRGFSADATVSEPPGNDAAEARRALVRQKLEEGYTPPFTGQWDDEWLDALRVSNQMLPLKGQVIVASVVHTDKKSVLVNTGFKMHQRFMKKELPSHCIVQRADMSAVELKGGEPDFRVGDMLHLHIKYPLTPYGDMHLEVQSNATNPKALAVVSELKAAQLANRPVMGRVLNAVNSGYAVGIGGVVAFLPSSRASLNTVKKLGVLQPFYIVVLDESSSPINVVVSDPYPARPRTKRIIRGRLL